MASELRIEKGSGWTFIRTVLMSAAFAGASLAVVVARDQIRDRSNLGLVAAVTIVAAVGFVVVVAQGRRAVASLGENVIPIVCSASDLQPYLRTALSSSQAWTSKSTDMTGVAGLVLCQSGAEVRWPRQWGRPGEASAPLAEDASLLVVAAWGRATHVRFERGGLQRTVPARGRIPAPV